MAVYVAAVEPALRLRVRDPEAAVRVSVTGEPLEIEVFEAVTPVPAATVHVPPDTEIVVVGFVPEPPARVSVIVVRVTAAV